MKCCHQQVGWCQKLIGFHTTPLGLDANLRRNRALPLRTQVNLRLQASKPVFSKHSPLAEGVVWSNIFGMGPQKMMFWKPEIRWFWDINSQVESEIAVRRAMKTHEWTHVRWSSNAVLVSATFDSPADVSAVHDAMLDYRGFASLFTNRFRYRGFPAASFIYHLVLQQFALENHRFS